MAACRHRQPEMADLARENGLRSPRSVPGLRGPGSLAYTHRLGRSWQCGTIQLDFVMPERFGLSYIDSRGGKARPVMLHRAIFGSIERFVAILLEHHQRALPAWLAPEQVRVLPISDEQAPYARMIFEALQRQGLRASLGPGSQTLSRAIVDAHDAGVVTTPKSGKPREVPLSDAALRALRAHRHLRGELVFCDGAGKMLSKGACKWPLRRACLRASLRQVGS
jgi:hypothetical protein